MSDVHRIATDAVEVVVSAAGAELASIRDAAGVELLWQAGPEWPRRAPVLFPIVGKLAGDTLRSGGAARRMTQHGFARDRTFAWIERAADRMTLRLTDDAKTRAIYPFGFVLDLAYAVEGATVTQTARVSNPGETTLPFCVGAHPAFRWPLVDGAAKESHALIFETRETGTARAIDGGLLGPDAPLPFDGETLPLSPELFAADALVLPNVASRSVRYVALGADGAALRQIIVAWRGYRDLGVWSKPSGAPFLCIEPWRGMASPVGWDGDFAEKPGVVLLPPGESAEFAWSVTV
ncbi:aldose 1-epimerase family protein [Methylopila henanensis]|uniref:Aldose 1-epimerase family protein n=1 Tax=Methylopila henanensis TaxID=873516 RepID=A0ABW4K3S8_9HYPH